MPTLTCPRNSFRASPGTCRSGLCGRCGGYGIPPNNRSIRAYLRLWRMLGRATGMAQGATQFCLRDTFTSLGGYDESLFMGEDVDFYGRMRRHAQHVGGRVRFIDELKVV